MKHTSLSSVVNVGQSMGQPFNIKHGTLRDFGGMNSAKNLKWKYNLMIPVG